MVFPHGAKLRHTSDIVVNPASRQVKFQSGGAPSFSRRVGYKRPAMTRFLIVAAGGALGAMARYGLTRLLPASGWPWATLTANAVGGLLMGILVGWLAFRSGLHGESVRLFAAVGVLGGFTTFSAFSLETVLMIERRQFALAGGYVAASVVLSIAALFIGLMVARRAFGAAL
jgi:CrcB protein